MIEVTPTGKGYQVCCRSPLGEKLAPTLCQSQQIAMTTAIQLIDYFFACQSLRQVLRESYETGTLTFEEWHRLGRSLDFASRHPFMQSPS